MASFDDKLSKQLRAFLPHRLAEIKYMGTIQLEHLLAQNSPTHHLSARSSQYSTSYHTGHMKDQRLPLGKRPQSVCILDAEVGNSIVRDEVVPLCHPLPPCNMSPILTDAITVLKPPQQ